MITGNLQKIAVALKYKYLEDKEPIVVASGSGVIADSILKKAKELDIPIHKDPKLAVLLKKVQVGGTIPEELYEIVAEVIAMVYRLDQKLGTKK